MQEYSTDIDRKRASGDLGQELSCDLTITLRLLSACRGMRGSRVCRKAIPLAISNANFTAWLWSTTKSKGGKREFGDTYITPTPMRLILLYSLVPSCSTLYRDPYGIQCVMRVG